MGGRRKVGLEGLRFGRLVVLQRAADTLRRKPRWLCRCDCERTSVVAASDLQTGATQSCGCLAREVSGARNRTHGETGSPAFKTWLQMRARCLNPRHRSFSEYGAVGITVCERWQSFECFLADMGERPGPGYTIERRDNARGYEPENCRWATAIEQARNKRNNRYLEHGGIRRTLAEWSEITGIQDSTIAARIDRLAWPVGAALNLEPRPLGRGRRPSRRLRESAE